MLTKCRESLGDAKVASAIMSLFKQQVPNRGGRDTKLPSSIEVPIVQEVGLMDMRVLECLNDRFEERIRGIQFLDQREPEQLSMKLSE